MSNGTLAWPKGHRVAVVVSVLLETWTEGKSPSYFPRTTPLAPGSKDVAGINWSRFGGNEGIWRLSRNLKDLDIPATLFCNGRSAEVWPEAVAAFAKAGHDVAGHGYLQDQTLLLHVGGARARDHQEDARHPGEDRRQAPDRLGHADLRLVREHHGLSRRSQARLVLGRARRQRALSAEDQERQDASSSRGAISSTTARCARARASISTSTRRCSTICTPASPAR